MPHLLGLLQWVQWCVCTVLQWEVEWPSERLMLTAACSPLVQWGQKVKMNQISLNSSEVQTKPSTAGCHSQKHAGTPESPGAHGNSASFSDRSFETLHYYTLLLFHFSLQSVITVVQGSMRLWTTVGNTVTLFFIWKLASLEIRLITCEERRLRTDVNAAVPFGVFDKAAWWRQVCVGVCAKERGTSVNIKTVQYFIVALQLTGCSLLWASSDLPDLIRFLTVCQE